MTQDFLKVIFLVITSHFLNNSPAGKGVKAQKTTLDLLGILTGPSSNTNVFKDLAMLNSAQW